MDSPEGIRVKCRMQCRGYWLKDKIAGSEIWCQDQGQDFGMERMPGFGEGCLNQGMDARIKGRMPGPEI
jgi:hypothetical protein